MQASIHLARALRACVGMFICIALVTSSVAQTAGDKYSLKVPGGLSFSEFRGYESWETISTSHSEKAVAVILGNPTMISAFKTGFPENGKPAPDGAKMAKIHWVPQKKETTPGQPTVSGQLHDVDFMVKDSKRFADGAGWGYAVFKYDNASNTFTPGTTSDAPPQANDAKCGVACHTAARDHDSVFSEYAKR